MYPTPNNHLGTTVRLAKYGRFFASPLAALLPLIAIGLFPFVHDEKTVAPGSSEIPTVAETTNEDGPFSEFGAYPIRCADRTRRITGEEAVEDAFSWLSKVLSVHPEPAARVSTVALKLALDEALVDLPKELNVLDLYVRIAPVVALLEDSHTNLSVSVGPNCPRPPLESRNTRLCLGRAWAGLPKGACLKQLGHLRGEVVFDQVRKMVPAERREERTRRAAELFPIVLGTQELRHANVALTFEYDGEELLVELADLPVFPQSQRESLLDIRQLSESAMYLRLRSMMPRYRAYAEEQLLAFFRLLGKSPEVRGLVVDLRDNEGGHTDVGENLLRHVTNKPFRMFAEKRWRVSNLMKNFIAEHVSLDSKYLALPDDAILTTSLQARAGESSGPRFQGAVVVLIGPDTVSAAMMTANAVEDYDLALLVGQPTGAPPNFFGEVFSYEMEHSALEVNISTARFVRANGDAGDPSPVRPDVLVEDNRSGEELMDDPQLRAALAAIEVLNNKRKSSHEGQRKSKGKTR